MKHRRWWCIPIPRKEKTVGCKWVCTVKFKVDGTIEQYQTRLVAKGYYGVDYQETFALMAKMNTVRILLSLALHFNQEIQQYDVKNVFFQQRFRRRGVHELPLGFDDKYGHNKVYKLKKAFYELK